jgi:hypothetical protein
VANETTFDINVQANADSAVTAAASVDELAARLTSVSGASDAATAALSAGEAAYARAESAADRAAKAVEKVSIAADAQRGKLAAALEVGDVAGAEKAAAKLGQLFARQTEAQAAADAAKSALSREAAALDGLRDAATSAAATQGKVSDAMGEAKKAADAAAKASKAAAGSGEAQDALEGIAKLSGPLQGTVMQAKELTEGWKKLSKSLGAAGPYVAIGAAFVAISAGIALAAGAAVVGLAQITSWAVQLADENGELKTMNDRLTKGFKGLFKGLKIGKLLTEMGAVVDIFDETNAAGKAIKVVFESLFQPIVDGVADFIPKVRSAFLELEILALKALIAIKPYGSVIADVAKAFGVMAAVVGGVVAIAIGLVVANLAVMAVGIGIVVTAAAALVAGVVWLSLKLQELTAVVGTAIAGAFGAAVDWLKAFDLRTIGSDLLDGLAQGIMGAGPRVLAALGGVVTGAIDSAKKLLGIASPSKVFAEIGGYTAEGMAQGVEGATTSVQGALETMVSPPEVKATPAESAGSGGSGASLSGVTFNLNGVAGAEDAERRIESLLMRILEGDLASLGSAVPT